MRLGHHRCIALAVLIVATGPALANTQSRDFGPHTKGQLSAICAQASGRFLTSRGKWSCDTAHWRIACVDYGKTCTIDLLGGLPAEGPSALKLVSPVPGTPGPTGPGFGAGAIGGQMGGGKTGQLGH